MATWLRLDLNLLTQRFLCRVNQTFLGGSGSELKPCMTWVRLMCLTRTCWLVSSFGVNKGEITLKKVRVTNTGIQADTTLRQSLHLSLGQLRVLRLWPVPGQTVLTAHQLRRVFMLVYSLQACCPLSTWDVKDSRAGPGPDTAVLEYSHMTPSLNSLNIKLYVDRLLCNVNKQCWHCMDTLYVFWNDDNK